MNARRRARATNAHEMAPDLRSGNGAKMARLPRATRHRPHKEHPTNRYANAGDLSLPTTWIERSPTLVGGMCGRWRGEEERDQKQVSGGVSGQDGRRILQ